MATYHDEVWQAIPEDRPLDRRELDFALETIATVTGADGAPTRVLDLGCGDGRFAAELAAAGAKVSGVDPSETALERAAGKHPELELVAPGADGKLPFADASFDAVVCINVLQHVADTQMLLSEARRVLVAGGRLAVAVPWHGRVKNVLIALGSFERHYDPLEPVLRFYTRRSLDLLLEQLGFEQVRLEGVGGIPLLRETLLAQAQRGSLRAYS